MSSDYSRDQYGRFAYDEHYGDPYPNGYYERKNKETESESTLSVSGTFSTVGNVIASNSKHESPLSTSLTNAIEKTLVQIEENVENINQDSEECIKRLTALTALLGQLTLARSQEVTNQYWVK